MPRLTAQRALTQIQMVVTEAVAKGDNSEYINRISDIISDQLESELEELSKQ